MLADDIAAALGAGDATEAELADRLGVAEQAVAFVLRATHGRFRKGRGTPALWALAGAARSLPPPGAAPALTAAARASGAPTVGGRRLYGWQRDALEAWRRSGRRGVVEAVTGTGKTVVGLAATVEQLEQRGQTLVLVPTVELQNQWVTELRAAVGGVGRIGRLGAGSVDTLVNCDVLVAVVNTARVSDVRPIRPAALLVGDECHRYASALNRRALDPRFTRRLGLSATYARDDDGHLSWLDPYFGGICFEMGYRRALSEAVTARFTLSALGVTFGPGERERYDELSTLMGRLHARLLATGELPSGPAPAFWKAIAALAEGDGEASGAARAYRQAMLERRRLLADTPAKEAGLALLMPAVRDAERALVFTESIESARRCADVADHHGVAAAVIHSRLTPGERSGAMEAFRAGRLKMLAAPRVLDEGVDVAAADLAVIVGASRSRRQMVQRMGRVLRRKPDRRWARFAVLFVQDTVEDPRWGAHEAFLEEMIEVADRVSYWPAAAAEGRPAEVVESLRYRPDSPPVPAAGAPEPVAFRPGAG